MLVTAAVVQPRTLEVYEDVVGTIENVIDPTVGAEVAGRVTRVTGFTGKKVARARCSPRSTRRTSRSSRAATGRDRPAHQPARAAGARGRAPARSWSARASSRRTRSTTPIAQRNALRQQLAAARARADATGRSLTKSRVVAPVDGEIETQIVAVGDYVKLGDPLFKLVGVQEMRVHLLLPEAAATRIKPGPEGGALAAGRARAGARGAHRRDQADARRQQPRARCDRQDSAATARCSAAAAR